MKLFFGEEAEETSILHDISIDMLLDRHIDSILLE